MMKSMTWMLVLAATLSSVALADGDIKFHEGKRKTTVNSDGVKFTTGPALSMERVKTDTELSAVSKPVSESKSSGGAGAAFAVGGCVAATVAAVGTVVYLKKKRAQQQKEDHPSTEDQDIEADFDYNNEILTPTNRKSNRTSSS